MTVIFEGTFGDLLEQMSTLSLPAEQIVYLRANDNIARQFPSHIAQELPVVPMTEDTVRHLTDTLDEEEARDAYRIGRTKMP